MVEEDKSSTPETSNSDDDLPDLESFGLISRSKTNEEEYDELKSKLLQVQEFENKSLSHCLPSDIDLYIKLEAPEEIDFKCEDSSESDQNDDQEIDIVDDRLWMVPDAPYDVKIFDLNKFRCFKICEFRLCPHVYPKLLRMITHGHTELFKPDLQLLQDLYLKTDACKSCNISKDAAFLYLLLQLAALSENSILFKQQARIAIAEEIESASLQCITVDAIYNFFLNLGFNPELYQTSRSVKCTDVVTCENMEEIRLPFSGNRKEYHKLWSRNLAHSFEILYMILENLKMSDADLKDLFLLLLYVCTDKYVISSIALPTIRRCIENIFDKFSTEFLESDELMEDILKLKISSELNLEWVEKVIRAIPIISEKGYHLQQVVAYKVAFSVLNPNEAFIENTVQFDDIVSIFKQFTGYLSSHNKECDPDLMALISILDYCIGYKKFDLYDEELTCLYHTFIVCQRKLKHEKFKERFERLRVRVRMLNPPNLFNKRNIYLSSSTDFSRNNVKMLNEAKDLKVIMDKKNVPDDTDNACAFTGNSQSVLSPLYVNRNDNSVSETKTNKKFETKQKLDSELPTMDHRFLHINQNCQKDSEINNDKHAMDVQDAETTDSDNSKDLNVPCSDDDTPDGSLAMTFEVEDSEVENMEWDIPVCESAIEMFNQYVQSNLSKHLAVVDSHSIEHQLKTQGILSSNNESPLGVLYVPEMIKAEPVDDDYEKYEDLSEQSSGSVNYICTAIKTEPVDESVSTMPRASHHKCTTIPSTKNFKPTQRKMTRKLKHLYTKYNIMECCVVLNKLPKTMCSHIVKDCCVVLGRLPETMHSYSKITQRTTGNEGMTGKKNHQTEQTVSVITRSRSATSPGLTMSTISTETATNVVAAQVYKCVADSSTTSSSCETEISNMLNFSQCPNQDENVSSSTETVANSLHSPVASCKQVNKNVINYSVSNNSNHSPKRAKLSNDCQSYEISAEKHRTSSDDTSSSSHAISIAATKITACPTNAETQAATEITACVSALVTAAACEPCDTDQPIQFSNIHTKSSKNTSVAVRDHAYCAQALISTAKASSCIKKRVDQSSDFQIEDCETPSDTAAINNCITMLVSTTNAISCDDNQFVQFTDLQRKGDEIDEASVTITEIININNSNCLSPVVSAAEANLLNEKPSTPPADSQVKDCESSSITTTVVTENSSIIATEINNCLSSVVSGAEANLLNEKPLIQPSDFNTGDGENSSIATTVAADCVTSLMAANDTRSCNEDQSVQLFNFQTEGNKNALFDMEIQDSVSALVTATCNKGQEEVTSIRDSNCSPAMNLADVDQLDQPSNIQHRSPSIEELTVPNFPLNEKPSEAITEFIDNGMSFSPVRDNLNEKSITYCMLSHNRPYSVQAPNVEEEDIIELGDTDSDDDDDCDISVVYEKYITID